MHDARTPVSVLALLASSAERDALRAIIAHSKWKLRFEERLGDVREVLKGVGNHLKTQFSELSP
jgi:hypothetical protein